MIDPRTLSTCGILRPLAWLCCLLYLPALAAGQPADRHWAYQPPSRPAVPRIADSVWADADRADAVWPRNAIDLFTLAAIQRHGWQPAPQADRATLIRRLTQDLTGLPPTIAEVDAFLADTAPAAYERLVERLLASPRYGQRMATLWLDLARYADTHGYHMDAHREMWRWRDGLIEALNANQSYRQFTIEQLAGDLLPGATLAQQIASGFNRNNMVNFEGGAIADEYLTEYAVDRVVTTATVWLGQTMHCARCHDHKYDPFTQRDYFRLMAFFNRVPENGIDGDQGNAAPFIRAPSPGQQMQLDALARRLADAGAALARRADQCADDLARWETRTAGHRTAARRPPDDMSHYLPLDQVADGRTHEAVTGQPADVTGPALTVRGKFERALLLGGETSIALPGGDFERTAPFAIAAWIFPTTAARMTLAAKTSDAPKLRGYHVLLDDGHVVVGLTNDETQSRLRVRTRQPLAQSTWQHVTVTHDGSGRAAGVAVYLDGRPAELDVVHDDLGGSIQTNKPLLIGRWGDKAPLRGLLDELRIYPRALTATEAALLAGGDPIGAILATSRDQRSRQQADVLRRYYLENHDPAYRELIERQRRLREQIVELEKTVPTTMVMQDAADPRPTFVLESGRYDDRGPQVTAGTPAVLPSLAGGQPANRLDLARWLVDPRNPLTARVAVNRYWQMFFGAGLVRTPEDFGSRGQRPTHPQLLDWLAVEFVESGWDVKHLQRLIVHSATYRQASSATPDQWQRDPGNRVLARGPRFRLSAEALRDSALAAAGLLEEQIGGPSVFPYQPAGLWEEVSYDPDEFTAQVYVPGQGPDLYRRSLYSFWKRSLPPPALSALGAPSRETCTVKRSPTNTPLEALVLMNETAFVEASRALAQRMLGHQGSTAERLAYGFRRVLSRRPRPRETQILRAALDDQRHHYRRHADAARELIAVGQSEPDAQLDPVELAAWTTVANMLLSLDEALTRN